jgi:hypothetical protein
MASDRSDVLQLAASRSPAGKNATHALSDGNLRRRHAGILQTSDGRVDILISGCKHGSFRLLLWNACQSLGLELGLNLVLSLILLLLALLRLGFRLSLQLHLIGFLVLWLWLLVLVLVARRATAHAPSGFLRRTRRTASTAS